jgi:hypothetical protein
VPGLYRLAMTELSGDVDHSAATQLVERWAGVELR